jgi:biopolymer transport protein ExbD
VIAKRQSAVRPRIDVSAFVAVMLAILWAFMGDITPDVRRGGPPVDLFHAHHSIEFPKALREDVIDITVTRAGSVFFGTDRVNVDQLPIRIRDAVRSGSENRVYIHADARTKYGNVTDVIDQIHASGVQNVSILTEWRH